MRRKGVSPVIATLLLIVIAVAAAVLAYIWVTGYMGTLQAQAGAQQVQERIKIEGVKISSDGTIQTVYVRNIGDTQVKIVAVYLLDSGGSVLGKIDQTTTLSPESAIAISATTLPTVTAGKTYIIKVVTARGTEATYQFTYRP
ncbi:MAG: archaellin/type IV pilin N-terminal domain-containing protein [Candidatus Bathyarchaeia archaeon]